MKTIFRNFWPVLKTAFNAWMEKDPFRESAIIAYYAIFSLPGLLVVVFTIASFFFSQEALNGVLHSQITQAMGAETADQVGEIMVKASVSKSSIWASIFGIITILVGATGVFVQLQKSMNTIWEVKAEVEKSGIWLFFKARFFSFGLILTLAFLLLISLVITTMLTALSSWVEEHWASFLLPVFQAVNLIFPLIIISLLFALMFKIMPDAKIKWKNVWLGALITGILFSLGKTGIGFYFGKADPASGYGAAGSVILILLWVAYSSMIVFLGAEFTKAYSEKIEGKIQPTELAKKVEVQAPVEVPEDSKA